VRVLTKYSYFTLRPGFLKRAGLIAVCLAAFTVMLAGVSDTFRRSCKEAIERSRYFTEDLIYPRRNLPRSGLPTYDIIVSPSNLRALLDNLPKNNPYSTEGDLLLSGKAKDYVRAEFVFEGRTYNVRVRFRGGGRQHWGYPKKSWRVRFPKKELFAGYRRLNFINPKDKDFLAEYFSVHLATKLGVLSPPITYAILRVNNEPQGVYYLVPQIDEYFLEKVNLPLGNVYGELDPDNYNFGPVPIYTTTRGWTKFAHNENQPEDDFSELDTLIKLLNHPDDETFHKHIFSIIDKENFMRRQAHAELLRSRHESYYHNARFYFNPTKGKFEFIIWDAMPFLGQTSLPVRFDEPYNPLVTRIFKSPAFVHERNKVLWDYVANSENAAEDLAFIDETYNTIRKAVYHDRMKAFSHEWATREPFRNGEFDGAVAAFKDLVARSYKRIYYALSYTDLSYVVTYNSKKDFAADKVVLGIQAESRGVAAGRMEAVIVPSKKTGNWKVNPSQLFSLYRDSNKNGVNDKEDDFVCGLAYSVSDRAFRADNLKELMYPGKEEQSHPKTLRYDYLLVGNDERYGLTVVDPSQARLVFSHALSNKPVPAQKRVVDEAPVEGVLERTRQLDEFLREHPYFRRSRENPQKLIVKRGSYEISKNVFVPEDATVVIEPGVKLTMAPGVSIIAYGPVEAIGIKEAPITFTSQGDYEYWGVVGLNSAKSSGSIFRHCVFEKGSDAYLNGIFYTGALSAYNCNVQVAQCVFRRNRGDDAFNGKNGSFVVSDSSFLHNTHDAVDYDFSGGEISRCYVYNSGNDGVDLGGASPAIKDNIIVKCGNVGISCGEGSRPLLVNNLIRTTDIGVASRDGSLVKVINSTLVASRVGLAAYQTKEIFPGGRIVGRNVLLYECQDPVQTDDRSTIDVKHYRVESRSGALEFADTQVNNYVVTDEALSAAGDIASLREVDEGYTLTTAPIGVYRYIKGIYREEES
jgi:hypothetical protein